MLVGMSDRGPDSAGIAIYRRAAPPGTAKLTLAHAAPDFAWRALAKRARRGALRAGRARGARHPRGADRTRRRRGRAGVARGERAGRARHELRRAHRDLQGDGPARRTVARALRARPRWRARTRSATRAWRPRARSRPSTRTRSRPASTSASSTTARSRTTTGCAHWLRRRGIALRDRQRQRGGRRLPRRGGCAEGATLDEALEAALVDLDGFYTFAVGTRDGFAVLRDPLRLQAGGARRDRRLGRDGVGVPLDRRPARAPTRRPMLGAAPGHASTAWSHAS